MFHLEICTMVLSFSQLTLSSPLGPSSSGNIAPTPQRFPGSSMWMFSKRNKSGIPAATGSATAINALSILGSACSSVLCSANMTFSATGLTASQMTTVSTSGTNHPVDTASITTTGHSAQGTGTMGSAHMSSATSTATVDESAGSRPPRLLRSQHLAGCCAATMTQHPKACWPIVWSTMLSTNSVLLRQTHQCE